MKVQVVPSDTSAAITAADPGSNHFNNTGTGNLDDRTQFGRRYVTPFFITDETKQIRSDNVSGTPLLACGVRCCCPRLFFWYSSRRLLVYTPPPPKLTRDSVTSSDRCKLQNRRETKQFHYHLTVVAKFTDFVKRNFTLTMADINLMYTTNTSNSVRLVNFSNQQTSHEVGAVCKTFDGFSTLQPPIALE